MMNPFETFNRTLFLQINGGDGTPAWLIQVAIGIADDLIYLIPLLLLGMWLWGDSARRGQAIKACLVTLLALGANQVIGLVWQHPRPFMIGLGHAWIPHATDSSFPSDHVTVFASIGLTLLFGGAFRLATTHQNPSSMAKPAVCRQPPKVGVECPNWARSVLCGGAQ